jgi:acyl-CoA synthetase (AMP-forming)/AMP-acid ligase II
MEIPRCDLLIHSILDGAVADAADSPAVRDAMGVWSYQEVADYSHAVDAWLESKGVAAGDRVIVQWPTTRELVAMFFGVCRRGAVFVPLNPAMRPYHRRSVVANAEPTLVLGESDAGPVWDTVQALRAAGAHAAVPAEVSPADIAVLIYTSGSTAAPKGVIGPHSQVTFAAQAINAVLGYRPGDVIFCRFPMSWDYGLYKVLLSCLGRSGLVLAGTESDLLLLRRIREVGATVVPIVPSLALMIATLADREPVAAAGNRVRMFTNTGAALPAATIAKLRAAFPGARVVRQFGQTECKRIAIMPPDQDGDRVEAVGLPLPGTRVLILDDEGRELPVGRIGEIVVTGPHVMPGYWRAPELTARTFRRDERTGELRLHTGDYGSLDADGYLYFRGRRDDMFKRKGIRMSTLEIEAAAMDIPGVRAVGAVPPSGDRDLALVVEADLAPHTVLRELAQRLEPAKVPALCRVVDKFPLTAHGKNAVQELGRLLDGGPESVSAGAEGTPR